MPHINSVVDLQQDGEIAVVVVESPPVNALSVAVRRGILRAVAMAAAAPEIAAIVLICAGRTFIAGADVAEFDLPPMAPSLAEMLDAIEGAAKPVVAALHGAALGGGLEIALAAHYRLAVPGAKLGLQRSQRELFIGQQLSLHRTMRFRHGGVVDHRIQLRHHAGKRRQAAIAL